MWLILVVTYVVLGPLTECRVLLVIEISVKKDPISLEDA